jgi:aryl-alcohol dehydrogenase-like predicted oxidoreductase
VTASFPLPASLIGMGCMRLSTEAARDEARAIGVLHAALDEGVNFLDTADAYCRDAEETGHNERLIARALATWGGDRSRILVATKGGLTRPRGEWVADGRARHLVAACEASRRALGVDRIDLYQLHAPDPRTPLSTSVRALAGLQRDGLIARVGLCNVTVGQIEEARRITEIAAVQVELSVWHDEGVLSGVAELHQNDIRLVAYRPAAAAVAARSRIGAGGDRGAPRAISFAIALAWLKDLSSAIVPIPGPTQVATAVSSARALRIDLTAEDRGRLDEQFPAGRILRGSGAVSGTLPAPALRDGEVVLIMGLPGAGKSTAARSFVAQGFARLNRDEDGGSLRGLVPALDRLIESGASRIVLDNTYVSRKSRAALIQAAAQRGLPVRCVWMATTLEDAQVNAVRRIVSRYGRLLNPEEMRQAVKQDISAFGPAVQFRYQRDLEPPDPAEGFSRIEIQAFARARDAAFTNRAVIVWCDGVLIRGRAPSGSDPNAGSDPDSFEERGAVLRRYADAGWLVLGIGWQPDIVEKAVTAAQADAHYAKMQERIGVAIDVLFLSPRRRPADLLVSKTAAGARRRPDRAAPPQPATVHLRRQRFPGPGVRAPAGVSVSRGRRVLRGRQQPIIPDLRCFVSSSRRSPLNSRKPAICCPRSGMPSPASAPRRRISRRSPRRSASSTSSSCSWWSASSTPERAPSSTRSSGSRCSRKGSRRRRRRST